MPERLPPALHQGVGGSPPSETEKEDPAPDLGSAELGARHGHNREVPTLGPLAAGVVCLAL